MIRTLNFDYHHYNSLEKMESIDKELVNVARTACRTAYAPYSDFKVGAAVRLRSGRILVGSNQESEVFPVGVCAERNLLYHYQSHHSDDPIETLAIASDPGKRECYPCGMCRQVIVDTEKRQGSPIRVIMAGGKSATIVETAQHLLPFTFKL
jgi:cytidine deaminase